MQPQLAPTAEDYAFSRLISYAAYQWPGYRDAAHHRLIARKLEAVERGDIKRLIITMPPRHGKSMLASEFFPAWYLGRNPDHYVITATYAQELSDDFGRKVKNQIGDATYQRVFPGVGLADDSQSSKRFHIEGYTGGIETRLKQRGAFYAVGVEGPLTGRGAHLLLIDDPVKNRDEADSELVRKKTRDWYASTAYTRLMPDGRVVIIQTRWHEDDLTGWLLREHAHEGWDHLNLPALDANGKALWPEQYSEETLAKIRLAIGQRDWSALYQQKPAPDEGNFFKREWFQYYDTVPELVHVYGASDYAVTDGAGDFTVHLTAAADAQGNVYISDLWRGQKTPDVWIESVLDMMAKHEPLGWAEENGQIIKSIGPFLERRAAERGIYCARQQFASTHDKATRARSFQARMASGKVFLPRKASWLADFEHELLSFPAGKNDDMVDAASLLFRMLAEMTAKDITPAEKPRDAWDRAFERLDDESEDSWKTA